MKREYYKNYSEALGKDMSMIVFGEGGYPVIAFQAQDGKSNNFEDFGMVAELSDYIDSGRIQLFSVDNDDEESWSATGDDPAHRTQRLEDYFRFVTDELVPKVHEWNSSELRPLAIGCSMGGTLAAIAATRRPDLFQGNISLSGVYHTSYFFGDYMDERLYANDVVASLSNMPADHPYVDILNHRTLVFCVGQGAWEEGVEDLHAIDRALDRLGIGHWCDFWGYDVNHDWPWWKKQIRYFMPKALDDIDRELAAEGEAAGEKAPKAEEKAAKAEAAPVKKAAAAAKTADKAAGTKADEAPKAAAAATTAKKPAAKKASTKRAAATKVAASEKATVKKAAAKKTAAKTAAKADDAKTAATTTSKAAEAPKAGAAETKAAAAKKDEPAKAAATKASTATKAEAKPAAAKAEAPKASVKTAAVTKPAATTKAAAPAKAAASKAESKPAAASKAAASTVKAAEPVKAEPATSTTAAVAKPAAASSKASSATKAAAKPASVRGAKKGSPKKRK